jgi:hypothetical protein
MDTKFWTAPHKVEKKTVHVAVIPSCFVQGINYQNRISFKINFYMKRCSLARLLSLYTAYVTREKKIGLQRINLWFTFHTKFNTNYFID